jgi:hypothetical protein
MPNTPIDSPALQPLFVPRVSLRSHHLHPRLYAWLKLTTHRSGAVTDPLVARVLAQKPTLSLSNVATTLRMVDYTPNKQLEWMQAMVVNHVTSQKRFDDVRLAFAKRAALTKGRDFCALSTDVDDNKRRRPFCSGSSFQFRCLPWRTQFPSVAQFPCCHNWTVCFDPPSPKPRKSAKKKHTHRRSTAPFRPTLQQHQSSRIRKIANGTQNGTAIVADALWREAAHTFVPQVDWV